jgi:hypothetical protein
MTFGITMCIPRYIQQDNALTNLKLDDPIFCEAAKQNEFDIRLICQPPNSPDFNILDLDIFSSYSRHSIQEKCKKVEALIPIV